MQPSPTATHPTTVRQTAIAGETFIRMNGALLVASQSEPGVWHQIMDAHCTCKGFAYRGYCRHLKAALALDATTIPTERVIIERTDDFGGGWVVNWGGFLHGGTHSRREDAEGHAAELRQAPDWDYDLWLTQHGYGAPIPPEPIPFPLAKGFVR